MTFTLRYRVKRVLAHTAIGLLAVGVPVLAANTAHGASADHVETVTINDNFWAVTGTKDALKNAHP
jgi:hypothetical protein